MNKNLKSSSMITIIVALFAAVTLSSVYGWSLFGGKKSSDLAPELEGKIIGVTKSSDGDVTVDLTPVSFEKGSLVVKISIDTHNVDDLYKYNLADITRLKTEESVVKPKKSPRLGGHHNSGEYEFVLDNITEKGFTITISGLNSPGDRQFVWP